MKCHGVVLLLCLSSVLAWRGEIPCSYTYDGARYDFSRLRNDTNDWVVNVLRSTNSPIPYSITFNLCRPIISQACKSNGADVGACQQWPLPDVPYFEALGTSSGIAYLAGTTTDNCLPDTFIQISLTGMTNQLNINLYCDARVGVGTPQWKEKVGQNQFFLTWKSAYGCPLNPPPPPPPPTPAFPKQFTFSASAVGSNPFSFSTFYDATRKAVAVREHNPTKTVLYADTVFDFQHFYVVQSYITTNYNQACCYVPVPPWTSVAPFFIPESNTTVELQCKSGTPVKVWTGIVPYLSNTSFQIGIDDKQNFGCCWTGQTELTVVSFVADAPSPSWFDYPQNVTSACTQASTLPCF